MKIKTNIEFLTFNDGIVDIFETDDEDCIKLNTINSYRFGNRTIGVTRYYAAKQNDILLKKVIHIHRNLSVTTQSAVVIDKTRYKVEQIQHLSETNPPCTVLSLSQRGVYEGEAYVRN